MDIARHVIGCRFTKKNRFHNVFDDEASTIHQSLDVGGDGPGPLVLDATTAAAGEWATDDDRFPTLGALIGDERAGANRRRRAHRTAGGSLRTCTRLTLNLLFLFSASVLV
jgi:hypothetical protein